MEPLVLHRPNALSPTLPSLQFLSKRSLIARATARPSPLLRPPPNTSFLRLPRSLRFKGIGAVRFDVPAADVGELSEIDDGDLVVETCIVRTLPPALTLEHGLEKIKEALEKLKMDPPRSARGMLRFQVCVPPSAKALSWFCCQPDSSAVFPQFFLSKETDNPTCKSLLLHDKRGVFGIGAAVRFGSSSSSNDTDDRRVVRRYLSNESTLITVYGFLDIDFDTDSSSMKNEAGSFSLFIPQIELDENVGVSTLAATLAWDGTCLHSVEEAIDSCELSLYQASSHFWPVMEKCRTSNVRSTIKKLDMLETKSIPMVYLNTLSERDFVADPLELKKAPSSCQFCFKLSPTFAFSSNMLDRATEMSFSLQSHANINAVWASLIIEECSRLGLTYFCVAPGSRSSPLAIAASSHPLITCIACYDERSLAFHALGYARGSRKPAVVITSSGTAVSNLLPAVVEASQDFIPLLLLTADRPPELHDAGANQAINQVNHFGSFVRFFFSLPVPSDHIPARMVLTTLDSAVHWATSSPYGPVHINCPFREPLDNSSSKWLPSCLNGLDSWVTSPEPFTKYIRPQHFHVCQDTHGQMTEVMKLISEVDRGLLIIGAIHTEDEIWGALLLAKHLSWPIVADILSGLRLRKLLTREIEDGLVFVDHLDHALLSDSVRDWVRMDAVIQIGSKITSKRVSQMLEDVFPRTYILVTDHPCRHDPSHIVTHRIQSTIVQFANNLLGSQLQLKSGNWSGYLQALDMMVSRDLAFQILATQPLTEPQLAYTVSEALLPECALFVGNSMAIRDADMYGHSRGKCNDGVAAMLFNSKLPCHGVQVVGNRGASGIDGLLSTAVGFAVGCNKRVFCVIGDVSFLHDTNGLSILNQRASRKPMTILVINNRGGAIFSLLPIANRTEPKVLDQYFYTSHDISVNKLCSAHGVKHVRVRTKLELQDALLTSQHEEEDSIIEVESSISSNASFHSVLRNSARQACDHALGILSGISAQDSLSPGFSLCKIREMDFSLYRIALLAPPTSTLVNDQTRFYREGFILSLSLEDGSVGFGEVAPLEIHKENLLDVEEQLKFLLHIIKGVKIGYSVPLLMGSFSSWIWSELGIVPSSIFPSVRCGLEMAILGAIAARQGSSLLNLLHPLKDEATSERSSGVRICALLDSDGTPEEVAYLGAMLVDEGFTAIKLKVARRGDPTEDAVVIQEVRKRVGHQIELRVDANRNWSYEEAIEFGLHVKNCNLQYIEEPVRDEDDIVKFCEETGLPVALDETIENIQGNLLVILEKYIHPRIVAVVIKPSVVGGFENAAMVARWAQQHGKMAVLSATFESSVGLSAYSQFSCYLELQNVERCKVMNKELGPSIAHGLGTYRWLEEDVTTDPLRIRCNPCNGFVEASVMDANRLLQEFQINREVVQKTFSAERVREYRLNVDSNGFSYSIKVHETGQMNDSNVVVFLHGFLGTGEDWIDIMKSVSGSARCISIDLPGHGESTTRDHAVKVSAEEPTFSIENITDVLCRVVDHITDKKVTIVGYSMGARIALFTALRFGDKVEGAIIISGSPGLRDNVARKIRKARDDSKARALIGYGLQCFLDSWYAGDLWKSLWEHPRFERIVTSRAQHGDAKSLARALSDLSTGRQPSLWEDLKRCEVPLLVVVGEKDVKFKKIAREMIGSGTNRRDDSIHDMVEVPGCGHAVHLENPLQTIQVLRQFLTRLRSRTNVTGS